MHKTHGHKKRLVQSCSLQSPCRKNILVEGFLNIYLSIYRSICLSIYLSIYLSICLSSHLSIYLSIYLSFFLLSIYLSFFLFSCLSIYLSICPSIYLSIYLSNYVSIYLSTYLSICKLENQASLRDVFIVQSWQHQKRGNSARLPQCLNLTTSKTQQVCETSSFSKLTTF